MTAIPFSLLFFMSSALVSSFLMMIIFSLILHVHGGMMPDPSLPSLYLLMSLSDVACSAASWSCFSSSSLSFSSFSSSFFLSSPWQYSLMVHNKGLLYKMYKIFNVNLCPCTCIMCMNIFSCLTDRIMTWSSMDVFTI